MRAYVQKERERERKREREIQPEDWPSLDMDWPVHNRLPRKMCEAMTLHACIFSHGFSDFMKYWKRTWNWRYGNCYTFNSGATRQGKKIPVMTSTKPGPKYGTMKINQTKYYLDCKTVVFGRFRKARSAVSVVRILTVVRVREKYDCFAV